MQRRWDLVRDRIGLQETLRRVGPRPTIPPELLAEDRSLLDRARGTVQDVAVQAFAGPAEFVTSLGRGVAGLAEAAAPEGTAFDRLAKRAKSSLDRRAFKIKDATEPETLPGKVTRFGTRFGPEVLAAVAPGNALRLATGSRGASALAGVGADAAVEGVIEAGQDPQQSLADFLTLERTAQSPEGRAAVGAIFGGVVGLPFEGIQAVKKARRARAKQIEEVAEKTDEELARVWRDLDKDLGPADSDVQLDRVRRDLGDGPEAFDERLAREKAAGADPRTDAPRLEQFAEPRANLKQVAAAADEGAVEARNLRRRLAGLDPGSAEYQVLSRQLDRIDRMVTDAAVDMTGAASQAGQDLANFRWMARRGNLENRFDVVQFARRNMDGDLTPGQMKEIEEFVSFDDAGKVVELDDKALARYLVEQREPLTWGSVEFITTSVRAGMLSALYSPLRPLLGNPASVGSLVAGSPVRAAADRIGNAWFRLWARGFDGKEKEALRFRTSRLRDLPAAVRAGLQDVPDNLRVSAGIFRNLSPNIAETAARRGAPDVDPEEALDALGQARESLVKQEVTGRPLQSGVNVPEFVPGIGGMDIAEVNKRVWFGLQGFMDSPFRLGVAQASLRRQARELATRFEGLGEAGIRAFDDESDVLARSLVADTGDERTARALAGLTRQERIDRLMEAPTPHMMVRANEDAHFAAFQNDTRLNEMVKGLRQGTVTATDAAEEFLSRNVAGGAGRAVGGASRGLMDLIIPFSRTPSAIATRTIEATPLGLIATVTDLLKLLRLARGLDPEDLTPDVLRAARQLQGRMARRMGEMTTMSALAWMVGRELGARGLITGGMPSDSRERQQFLREGKSPYSVRVGDKWVSLAQIPPFGHALALGAQVGLVQDEIARQDEAGVPEEERKGVLDLAATTATTGVDVVAETPFAQGVQRISDFLDSPESGASRLPSAIANTVGSFVPNLVQSVARSDDPIRAVRRDQVGTAVRDALVQRVPGIRQELPVRRDEVTGDALQRESTPRARALSLIDPFGSSPARSETDPVIGLLDELDVTVSGLRQLPEETERDFNERLAREGPIIRSALDVLARPGQATRPQLVVLQEAGVTADEVRDFFRFRALDSPEGTEAAGEILKDIVSKVRRFNTTIRGRTEDRSPEQIRAFGRLSELLSAGRGEQ